MSSEWTIGVLVPVDGFEPPTFRLGQRTGADSINGPSRFRNIQIRSERMHLSDHGNSLLDVINGPNREVHAATYLASSRMGV